MELKCGVGSDRKRKSVWGRVPGLRLPCRAHPLSRHCCLSASDRVLIALPDVKATILRGANYLGRRCVRAVDEPAARELR